MKPIYLLLEDDEIFILRSQVRFMQIFAPDGNDELLKSFTQKILQATSTEISEDWRKEIGKMQRALRKIKETPFYSDFMVMMEELQKKLMEEMLKEGDNPPTI